MTTETDAKGLRGSSSSLVPRPSHLHTSRFASLRCFCALSLPSVLPPTLRPSRNLSHLSRFIHQSALPPFLSPNSNSLSLLPRLSHRRLSLLLPSLPPVRSVLTSPPLLSLSPPAGLSSYPVRSLSSASTPGSSATRPSLPPSYTCLRAFVPHARARITCCARADACAGRRARASVRAFAEPACRRGVGVCAGAWAGAGAAGPAHPGGDEPGAPVQPRRRRRRRAQGPRPPPHTRAGHPDTHKQTHADAHKALVLPRILEQVGARACARAWTRVRTCTHADMHTRARPSPSPAYSSRSYTHTHTHTSPPFSLGYWSRSTDFGVGAGDQLQGPHTHTHTHTTHR